MKKKIQKIIKTIIFLSIVGVLFMKATSLCIPQLLLKEQYILYEEEAEDSIDIAFIGSSSTYRFYDVMAIWGEYNITSMCYYVASMPYDFITTMIQLAQEHQSPEVYVIDLRHIITDEYKVRYFGSYESDLQKDAYINALNLLPNTTNKWNAIFSSKYLDGEEYLQVFDLLYNHESSSEGFYDLFSEGGSIDAMEYKGNYTYYGVKDLSEEYVDFDLIEEDEDYTLTEETTERIIELLEYCNENEINAYFTITPYVHSKGVIDQETRREFGELIESYGYPYGDYRAEFEEIGMDPEADFYDETHANAQGAQKYSLYVMEDILEVYDIEADYEQAVIDDWNATYEEWLIYDGLEKIGLFDAIDAIKEAKLTSE